jgi:uncharacterized membrane protein
MQSNAMTDGNASQAPVPARTSFLGRFRNYFFTGIVIIAPVVITIWATIWFISFFDSWVKPVIPFNYNPDNYLPFTVPGTGLVVAVLIITTVGALGANLVGRTLLGWWDRVVQRTPVVRSIYKASKQIFETLFSQKGTNFKYVCLVEWPHKNMWTIAFVSREIDGAQIGLEAGRRMYAVYVSTTPNPTGGYVVFADESDVQILNMSVEDGLKLVISMGLVMPDKRMSASVELKRAAPAKPRRKSIPRSAT